MYLILKFLDISLGVLVPPRCRGGVSSPGPEQTDGPIWQNCALLGDKRRLCVVLDRGPGMQQAPSPDSLEDGSWGSSVYALARPATPGRDRSAAERGLPL